MNHRSNFREEENEEQLQREKQSQGTRRNFESVEELLRYDASQVNAPPGLLERVRQTARQTEGKTSLLGRLFRRNEEK